MTTPAATTGSALDYSVLAQPVTDADIKAFKLKYDLQASKYQTQERVAKWVLALTFGAVFVWFVLLPVLENFGPGTILNLIFWSLMITTVASAIYFLSLNHQKKLVKFDRLATKNNLTFIFDKEDPPYQGMIFDEGHSRRLNQAFVFPSSLEIGNYSYVTGSGKSRQTHAYGFARIPLPRKLPHMVLDSQQNNFFGMSNLPDFYSRSQVLSLEGDFDKHFKLYAPQQYERDALYVFTPDVMAALIDSGKNYDMEIVDDSLYIYKETHHDLLSAAQIEPLLKVIATITSEITKQTGLYTDDRMPKGVSNQIAPNGQRLKSGINHIAILVGVLFVLYQISEFVWPDVAWVVPLLFMFAVWAVVIGSVIKRVRQ